MTKAILVTGTDTGVGKTVTTGLLARFFLTKGCRVITQKWVQTGCAKFPEEIQSHLRLMQKTRSYVRDYYGHVSPYVFDRASSPHLASGLEKRKIRKDKIKDSFAYLLKRFDFVIVEGSGGALVPFDRKHLLIDIAKDVKIPVLIVAGNRLGAINHTLLTIEALKRRKLKILGVIFNNQKELTQDIILKDNPRIIRKLTGQRILGTLPRLKNKEALYRKFIPIGEKIYKIIK